MEKKMKPFSIIIQFDNAFRRAIKDPDNFTKNGINWDFVESDICIDLDDLGFTSNEINKVIEEEFDFAAEEYGKTAKEMNS